MERSLKAFVSYRRHDTFMQPEIGGKPNFAFIDKLSEALSVAGFTNVFIDKTAVKAGDHYESQIHRAIADCDLFVAVIGGSWLDILHEKVAAGERDILVREIRAALKQEKEIVPLLIDGADMPKPSDLPEQIRSFHYANGVSIESSASAQTIAAKLTDRSREVAYTRKLGSRWKRAYIVFAFFAYYFCAIQPHIIGVWEFGLQPWVGMAKVWSGFYIWPIFFLPFALVALYRPLTVIIESAANAARFRDVLTYLTPLVLGTLISLLAVAIEVLGPVEVPWSIHPALPGCPYASTASGDLAILSSYDQAPDVPGAVGPLHARYSNEFWLKDKCWPNVFYYLTVPVYQNTTNAGYLDERAKVQRVFMSVLRNEFGAPYSGSFFPYVLSFTILIWLGCTGVIMSVFYVTVQIRRPSDDAVLRLPSEDAYLCLTYSFVTLMVWVPFRMNTIYFKNLYFCETLEKGCKVDPVLYLNDWVLGTMLLIGYVFLTVGLLVKYHRLVLGLLSAATVATIILGAFAVFRFSADIAQLTDLWQFYVGISIPSIVVMLALWYQFDPSVVHFNDFKKEID
jgi:hypothetical protein